MNKRMDKLKDTLSKKYWVPQTLDLRENGPLSPVESGYPITSITLDLTTGCSLACHYCFTNLSKGKYKIENLTFDQGAKTIDWLLNPGTRGDSKKVDIAFWGGEPLIRYDLIKELVAYGEKRGKEEGVLVTFSGTTNVVNLDREKLDFFKEHRIQFLLSIDGRKETHDTHRVFPDGRGSFDTINERLDDILEVWPNAQVRLSFSVENIEGFFQDVKFLYERGFKNIAYSPVSEGDWTEDKLKALDEQWDLIGTWWKELRKEGKEPYIKYINDGCARSLQPGGNHAPCGAGRGYVGVAIDGSIYPCHRFHKFNDDRPWYEKEVCIGHIDHGILNQLWRENFIKWDSNVDLPESCKSCTAFQVSCNGGCWATNWDLSGNLGISPEVACHTERKNLSLATDLLGSEIKDSLLKQFKPQAKAVNNIPLVQGCQCYNVEDNLFGRLTKNPGDPHSCLCNMATYGTPPRLPVERCTCYNLEDQVVTHWDNEDLECRQYTKEKNTCDCEEKDPIQKAIDYLKGVEIESLSLIEKNSIIEFSELLDETQN
jgi:uncharacterized protein